LCADFSSKRPRIDVVDEGAAAVDLHHGQPLPVLRLELGIVRDVDFAERDAALPENRPRAIAEVTASRVEQDDVGYG
jgi:hypothetical protein